MEIKKVSDKRDLGVVFNDTFKADNHILFIVSNGMIAWMVRNVISKVADVLKIYKTLIRSHME